MAAPTIEHNNLSQELKTLLEKHKIPEGQKVRFRRLGSASLLDTKTSDDFRVSIERLPAALRLLREAKIMDPGTNRVILLANITGYSQKDGHMVPDIEELVFKGNEGNIIEVGEHEYEKYARLLLADENKDSPNPRKRMPPNGELYELVKPDAAAKAKTDARKLRARAVVEVNKITEEAEVLELTKKLSLPYVEGTRPLTTEELTEQLGAFAEQEPQRVLDTINAGERKLEQLVKRAVAAEIIEFNPETQQWRMKSTQEGITTAVQGFTPDTSLVRYMQNDPNGAKFSQALSSSVGLAEKAKKDKK